MSRLISILSDALEQATRQDERIQAIIYDNELLDAKLADLRCVLKPAVEAALKRYEEKNKGYPLSCPFCGESSQSVASVSRGTYLECAAYEMNKTCLVSPRTPYLSEADDGDDECVHVWNQRPEQEQADEALLEAGRILWGLVYATD